jgi:hypothetical protein
VLPTKFRTTILPTYGPLPGSPGEYIVKSPLNRYSRSNDDSQNPRAAYEYAQKNRYESAIEVVQRSWTQTSGAMSWTLSLRTESSAAM